MTMPNLNFAIPGLMEMQSPVSDALPPFVSLPPHSASTTNWDGIESIGPVTNDGSSMAFAAASVVMEFARVHLTDDVTPEHTITSEGGGIVINDAAAWLFEVPPQPLPLTFGLWEWTIKITDTSGAVLRLYDGSIYINA